MLWKRESNQINAPLVDILHREYYGHDSLSSMHDLNQIIEKSNDLSDHYRKKGVELYEADKWFEAIEFFNQALCFAEIDSTEMICSFVDRASCFLQLKMYDSCLTDIKWVKANECLQQEMLISLDRMIAICEQKKKQSQIDASNTQIQFELTLSLKVNKKFPCTVNAIQSGLMDDSSRFVKATCEIDVGQTILIEDGFVSSTVERYKRCCICLKTTTNLVPCKCCTDSLFCYETCENNSLHSIECNIRLTDTYIDDDEVDSRLVIRSILLALEIFPNMNELDCFIGRVLFDKNFQFNEFDLSPKSKYAIFLQNGKETLKFVYDDGESKIFYYYYFHFKLIHFFVRNFR